MIDNGIQYIAYIELSMYSICRIVLSIYLSTYLPIIYYLSIIRCGQEWICRRLRSATPIESYDPLPSFQTRTGIRPRFIHLRRNQFPFPKEGLVASLKLYIASLIICMSNCTLRKGDYPDLLRTFGYTIQVDADVQGTRFTC